MNKKTLLAAGFALACTLSAPVFATDTIMFDPDGTGEAANGTLNVGSFDWAPGSTLSVDTIPTAAGDDVVSYSHASLGILVNENGIGIAPSGLNTNFEITFVAGFTETIDSVETSPTVLVSDGGDGIGGGNDIYTFSQTITLVEAGTQTVNFFEIYYDDFSAGSQNNPLAGTGYRDGQLILSAELVSLSGNFTADFTFVDVDNSGGFNAGDILQTSLLDQFGADQWGGQQTISGEGSTQLVADVTFQDYDFFISNVSALVQDLFFNTSNILPFAQTNPSMQFDGSVIIPDIGAINGFSGPDILFQTDANSGFVTTEVPEPSTVLLFGLGLLLLGFGSRNQFARRS